MIWFAMAMASPCDENTVLLAPGQDLVQMVEALSQSRVAVLLPPGVYQGPIDASRFEDFALCGLAPGVTIAGDAQPALVHQTGSGNITLQNLVLAPVNTAAVDVELSSDRLILTGVEVSPTGIHSAIVVQGVGDVDVSGSLFSGGTAIGGAHLRLEGELNARLSHSSFLNAVASVAGGSVLIGADVELVVLNSDFRGNRALRGGAISSRGALEIQGGLFEQNVAVCQGACENAEGRGGAVWSANPAVVLDGGTLFEGNQAASDGGALALLLDAASVVRNITLCKNEATERGGGLYTSGSGSVGQVRFLDNAARQGGGGFGAIQYENVNFLGNRASDFGAALHCPDTEGCASVRQSLFAYNLQIAPALERSVVMQDNLFWRNDVAGPTNDGNQIFDPVLRGYAPGQDCSLYTDFHGAVSKLTLGGGAVSVGLRDVIIFCEDNQCEPGPAQWGAYGPVDGRAGGFALVAWRDQDEDGWPAVFDCNDRDGEVNPTFAFRELAVDQDCDGMPDYDGDGDGFPRGVDCNDDTDGIFPGAVDNDPTADLDCDGFIEDRLPVYRPTPCAYGCGPRSSGDSAGSTNAGSQGVVGMTLTLFLIVGMSRRRRGR